MSNVSSFYVTEWPSRTYFLCLPPVSLYKMFRPSSPMQCDSRHKGYCKSFKLYFIDFFDFCGQYLPLN